LSGDNGKPKPGKDKEQGVPEAAVKLLAAELYISIDRSRQVFRDLDKVKARGEDIVKDPAFVAIAKDLRITPALAENLIRPGQTLHTSDVDAVHSRLAVPRQDDRPCYCDWPTSASPTPSPYFDCSRQPAGTRTSKSWCYDTRSQYCNGNSEARACSSVLPTGR
jgi:hypothetical protein